MARSLRSAGQDLTTFPDRGRPTGIEGVRELIVPGTPYLLVYRVKQEVVEILRVWHGAQDRGSAVE